jgi:hypothetical protein
MALEEFVLASAEKGQRKNIIPPPLVLVRMIRRRVGTLFLTDQGVSISRFLP